MRTEYADRRIEGTPSSGSVDENDNLGVVVPQAAMYEDETPFLLLPEMESFLRQLINRVNLRTFVRLSRTSHDMHRACMDERGRDVDPVRSKGNHLDVRETEDGGVRFKFWSSAKPKHAQFFQKDEKLPRLSSLHFKCNVTRAFLFATRDQMEEFEFVKDVTVDRGFDCWPEMLQFIQDYQVRKLWVYSSTAIPVECHARLMKQNQLATLEYGGPMADENIAGCRIATLSLLGARISPDTLGRIILHLLTGLSLENWSIGTRMTETDFLNCFSYYKQLPFDFKGDPPSSPPPFVFLTNSSLRVMFLPDGRLVEFHFHPVCIDIKAISHEEETPDHKCPPCLKPFYYKNQSPEYRS